MRVTLSNTASKSLILLLVLTAGCDSAKKRTEPQQIESDSSVDPDFHSVPTAEISFRLLAATPTDRRNVVRGMIVEQGKSCNLVTEMVLRGGFDGIDLWHAVCADSGEWLVTVETSWQPRIESCTEKPKECQEAWESVKRIQ